MLGHCRDPASRSSSSLPTVEAAGRGILRLVENSQSENLRLSENSEIVSSIGMIIMLMTMMTQEKDSSVEPRSDVEWTRKHRWQCEWQCYHYQWHSILLLPLLLKFPPPHIHDNDDDHDNNDDQDQALSPESRHSNGSALGLGTSPVVQVLASSY